MVHCQVSTNKIFRARAVTTLEAFRDFLYSKFVVRVVIVATVAVLTLLILKTKNRTQN